MTTEAAGNISWDEMAGWYDRLLRAGSGAHETAVECLRRLLPPLDGADVIDVACGQGLATRVLVDAGAGRVLGVDASAEMIDLATGHGSGADYRVDDAQTLATCADASFDGATCQLALMDIPDLDAALTSIHRVLKPGGWFVFSIGHPCILVPDARPQLDADGRPAVLVTGYFEERFWRSSNPHGVRRVGNYHRTLATYLNALIRAGFRLEAVEEPEAAPGHVAQQPLYAEVPIFFAARVREDT